MGLNLTNEQLIMLDKKFQYDAVLGEYGRSHLKAKIAPERLLGQEVVRFTTQLLTGRTIDKEYPVVFPFPASWWQHFKLACFPGWLLRRFPVRYGRKKAVVKFSQDILYPKADIMLPPNQFGHYVLWERAWVTGDASGPEPPSRFADRWKIISEMSDWMWRQTNVSYPGVPGPDRKTLGMFLEWLERAGVNPDQLVRREGLDRFRDAA